MPEMHVDKNNNCARLNFGNLADAKAVFSLVMYFSHTGNNFKKNISHLTAKLLKTWKTNITNY